MIIIELMTNGKMGDGLIITIGVIADREGTTLGAPPR